MNKKELAAQLAEKTGLAENEVNDVLEAFCDLVGTALQNGDSVRILGWGKFEARKRPAYVVKNPRTGKNTNIPAFVQPVFKAGKKLKEKANNR